MRSGNGEFGRDVPDHAYSPLVSWFDTKSWWTGWMERKMTDRDDGLLGHSSHQVFILLIFHLLLHLDNQSHFLGNDHNDHLVLIFKHPIQYIVHLQATLLQEVDLSRR